MTSLLRTEYYIGLMSGTSLDGIDAALVRFGAARPELIAARYEPYPPAIRQELRALCYQSSVDLIALGEMDTRLGRLFGESVNRLLEQSGMKATQISAIGSHGQTVFHRPEGPNAFSLQIADPNHIVQATGITTVADFRRRDIAAAGQGAPLTPAFHKAFLQCPDRCRVVVNLGGIANLTVLPRSAEGQVFGFDSGPANTLMDAWAMTHLGKPRDNDGAWARSGKIDHCLLNALLADPYFAKPPPKSTGQEYFSLGWLQRHLHGVPRQPADVQATLCELTAASILAALRRHAPEAEQLFLCGGGVHNGFLRERIEHLAPCPVFDTDQQGLPADWLEAIAFAWLARQTLKGLPGNLPEVTGAKQPVVLGGIYRP